MRTIIWLCILFIFSNTTCTHFEYTNDSEILISENPITVIHDSVEFEITYSIPNKHLKKFDSIMYVLHCPDNMDQILDRATLYYDRLKKKTDIIRTKNIVKERYDSDIPSTLMIKLYGYKGNNRLGPGDIWIDNKIEIK